MIFTPMFSEMIIYMTFVWFTEFEISRKTRMKIMITHFRSQLVAKEIETFI